MPSPKLATSTCRVCSLGTDRERVLLAIQRDPKASRTRIVKSMHITHSRTKQQEIFDSISFRFVNGQWQVKELTVAAD